VDRLVPLLAFTLVLRPPFLTVPIDGVNPWGVIKGDFCDRVLGKEAFLFMGSDSGDSVFSVDRVFLGDSVFSVDSDSNDLGLLFLLTKSDAVITVGGGASFEAGPDEFTSVSMLSRFCGFSRRVGDPPAGISKVLGKWVILSEPFRLVFGSCSLSSKTMFFWFFFFNCFIHMGMARLQAPHQLARTTRTVPQPLDNTLSRLFVIDFDFI